jgi:hypothetical protein
VEVFRTGFKHGGVTRYVTASGVGRVDVGEEMCSLSGVN